MLPGFLTTALEIIVILDVCGVIAYFTITGLTRMKDKRENLDEALPTSPQGMPALAGASMPAMVEMPQRITSTVYDPVVPEPTPQTPAPNQWIAGFKQRVTSVTNKFAYKPSPNGNGVQTQKVDSDYAKLGRVLDSFKEDT